jgi:hypothetical protein
VQLEELEDVAADAAAKAVEKSLVRVNVERGGLLVMERAVPFVGRARALQGYILLHNLEDVRLKAKVVDELLRKKAH